MSGRRSVKISHTTIPFDVPHYLKTMWTSKKADEFSEFLTLLDGHLNRRLDLEDSKTHVVGFRETFRILEKSSASILCVIACVDNCKDTSWIPRLCWTCHEMGVPLVLGRDPRRLAKIFQNGQKIKRVGCMAITKFAGAKEELLQFVLGISGNCSDIHLAVRGDDVVAKFDEVCGQLFGGVPQKVAPQIEPRSEGKGQPKKKQKTGEKKSSFFSNFD